jgi:hypothetical protein
MLYGGDLPAFMVLEPKTFKTRDPVNLQWASGAIHLRLAEHPWGAARRARREPGEPREDVSGGDWSSPTPVLTRQLGAPYLACGKDGPDAFPGCARDRESNRSFRLISELAAKSSDAKFGEIVGSCLWGEGARAVQETFSGDPIGRLYAPNILDEWTQDVTAVAGERSAEIYWNVSTWNPYQVVLVKTRLTSAGAGERAAAH